MNKAVVVFLREVSLVQHLVEFGLSIRDTFLPVLPLSSPFECTSIYYRCFTRAVVRTLW